MIASQLAGNALSKVAPGGGAMGAALQYRMLVQAGVERLVRSAGLTAANLLTFAVVLGMPVLAVPAIVAAAWFRAACSRRRSPALGRVRRPVCAQCAAACA